MASILDALNESISNFKNTRIRNRSFRPENSFRRNDSSKKLNSSSSEAEYFSIRGHFKNLKNQEKQDYDSGRSNKTGTSNSVVKSSFNESKIGKVSESNEVLEGSFKEEGLATACFSAHKANSGKNSDFEQIRLEIEELKNEHLGLKSLAMDVGGEIEKKQIVFEAQPKASKFSELITRITDLQGKFSNRAKTSFQSKKLSDLFGKISCLEQEAQKIQKENEEIETLYHSSLIEIYEKIERLRTENKALTEIILASPGSNSPKHFRNGPTEQAGQSKGLLLKSIVYNEKSQGSEAIEDAGLKQGTDSGRLQSREVFESVLGPATGQIVKKDLGENSGQRARLLIPDFKKAESPNVETHKFQLKNGKEVLYSKISLKEVVEKEKAQEKVLESLLNQKVNYEEDLLRIQQDLNSIPHNSKSMANKKKKQGLEVELLSIKKNLEEVFSKLEDMNY